MSFDTTDRRLAIRWVNGVLVVFVLLGLGFGTWLSRLPAVRDRLDASTLEMSVFGLMLALGSVTGLVLAGRAVSRLGPHRTMTIGVLVQVAAMPAAGLLFWAGWIVPAVACLIAFGFAFSTTDVAMNVSGANAERARGLPRMPLLHAGFSLGTVTAMGTGSLAETLRVPVPIHFAVVFAGIAAGALLALRMVPRDETEADGTDSDAAGARERYNPWRDPRVYAIGLIAMSMGLAEGVASDWLPLALVDGRGLTNELATLTLAVFLGAMTLTRLAGSWLLTRFGRVTMLRAGALLIIVGVALVILVPSGWAILVGTVLWGAGSALGFPVAMSAAADDPKTAVRGVAAVAAIAYAAYLLGPMGIGFLGQHFTLMRAFWVLVGFAILTLALAGSARQPESGRVN